jgi:SPX domain protein involved in polyphosphate accumulation
MGETKHVREVPIRSNGDRMLACRYELKYLIREAAVAAVENYIGPFLELDRYSKGPADGYYSIVSLYMDSPGLRLCRETLTGLKNRFKLRIRSYTDDPQYPRFFEIKRRLNQVIVKSRARVLAEDVARFARGWSPRPESCVADVAALNQFQFYAARIDAGPMMLVRYRRKAYECPGDNKVRVTFDRDLCYKVMAKPEVTLGGPGWQRSTITEGYSVLEIKFTRTFPVWLSRMAAHLNLQVGSVSKYATSIQQSCALGFCAPTMMMGSRADG